MSIGTCIPAIPCPCVSVLDAGVARACRRRPVAVYIYANLTRLAWLVVGWACLVPTVLHGFIREEG